jgi:hypothetical protein
MKVRSLLSAVEADIYFSISHLHITVPRNRAHHRLQGHDGSVQVREGSSRSREAQRRVEELIIASQHPPETNTDTSFPWVKSLLGTVCVQPTGDWEGYSNCHISPQCTEFRGICAFQLLATPSSVPVHKAHCTHKAALNLCAVKFGPNSRTSLCVSEKLITINRNITGSRHHAGGITPPIC